MPSPLSRADFDELLREVLTRVEGVLDEQARLRLLLDAVVTMAADLTLDGVLARIVSIASTLVDAQYAALGVLGGGPGRRLRTFIHHGMDRGQVAEIGELPAGHGLLGRIIDHPEPLRLHDIAAHPESFGFPPHHPPMTSFLGVPVRIRDQVFGNLYLTEKAGGGDFTEEDEDVVVALAAAAGVVIENARLYEQTTRREHWLRATAEINRLLTSAETAVDPLQTVADLAREVAGADVSWVVAGADADELSLQVVSGAPADVDAMRMLDLGESLASRVVRTGEPVAVEDLAADPRALDVSEVLGWPRLGPTVVVPLGTSTGGVEGVLALAWTRENRERFHDLDPTLPAAFAEQAALALQVARARQDQQRLEVFQDRDRIGRDLHDLVIQRLFAVGLGLQGTARLAEEPEVAARLERAVDDLDATIKDIRRSIFALGAMEASADIQAEVTRLVERAEATLKFRPSLRFEGPVRTMVREDLAPDLLAVLSEALSNASRHAGASAVEVVLAVTGDEIGLTVQDNGRGLPDDVRESGVGNMRSRAEQHGGSLDLLSRAGAGTLVRWTVPAPRSVID
ncbi:GAF domain-containing protein [Nocardioides plantarum]|uniref:GAF domain-containing protein n=1 Tax=Nocardioides plantarum TaxID=29299 RepID=A0ABV5KAN0_9ACTN|nr:GAF domain-containing protein [Nocardioides plantarum]